MRRSIILILAFALIFILFVSSVASSREAMGPGDYPGVYYDNSNAVPAEVFAKGTHEIPVKPSIGGKLSRGWDGLGKSK